MKLKFINKLLFILFLLGIYTQHSFSAFSIKIPFPLSLFSGLIAFVFYYEEVNWSRSKFILFFFIGILFFSVINSETGFFLEKIKGVIQIFFVLISSMGIYALVSANKISLNEFEKIFFVLIIIIIFFSILELFPGFLQLSNKFKIRILKVSPEFIQLQIDRNDVVGGGWIRPFPFATEPSYVAIFYNIVLFLWLWVTKNKRSLEIFFALLIVGALLFRSLNLIWGVGEGILFLFLLKQKYFPINRKIVFSFLLSLFLIFIIFFILNKRTTAIFNNAEPSFYLRMIVSFQLLLLSVKFYPLFGVGMLNTEWLVTKYSEIYNDPSFYKNFIKGNTFIINNFCAHFAYFGILGGIVLLFVLLKFFDFENISKRIIFLFFFIVLSFSLGSYSGQMFWGYVFLIAGILNIYKNNLVY